MSKSIREMFQIRKVLFRQELLLLVGILQVAWFPREGVNQHVKWVVTVWVVGWVREEVEGRVLPVWEQGEERKVREPQLYW